MSFFDTLKESIFGSDPEILQEQQIESRSTLSPEQQQLMSRLAQFLDVDLEGVLGPEFEGQLAPGPGEIERLSLAALEDQSRALATGETAETLSTAQGALRDTLTRGPEDFDDFFTQTVQDPLVEDFERDILPRIGRDFGGAAFFGSERQEADSRAREDLLTGLSRERARTGFAARESDLNRRNQALGLTPTVTGAGGEVAQGILTGGILGRELESELLGAEYQDFLRRTGERDKRTNQILQALGLSTSENIITAPIVDPGKEGIFSDLIGAGAKLGSAFIGA